MLSKLFLQVLYSFSTSILKIIFSCTLNILLVPGDLRTLILLWCNWFYFIFIFRNDCLMTYFIRWRVLLVSNTSKRFYYHNYSSNYQFFISWKFKLRTFFGIHEFLWILSQNNFFNWIYIFINIKRFTVFQKAYWTT